MALSKKYRGSSGIKQLAYLLVDFINLEGHEGSMYGRKMDRAMAKDLISALTAYGLDLKLSHDLRDTIKDYDERKTNKSVIEKEQKDYEVSFYYSVEGKAMIKADSQKDANKKIYGILGESGLEELENVSYDDCNFEIHDNKAERQN